MSARGGPPTDERRSGRGSGGSSNRLGGRFECTDDADLRAVAARHVAHARERYPELRAVDPEVFVGIVVAWLQPLPMEMSRSHPDEDFLGPVRRHLFEPRIEALMAWAAP